MSATSGAQSLRHGVARPAKLLLKCVALFAIVLFLCYWTVLEEKSRTLASEEAREQQLKAAFIEKKGIAINLEQYRKQMDQLEHAFGALIQILPSRHDEPYEKVARTASVHNLRVEQMRVSQREQDREFYAELPANLKVSGSFHDIGAFLNDLIEFNLSTVIGDFRIEAAQLPGTVTMDASLKTFRYMDEEEIARQRKAAQAGKGKR